LPCGGTPASTALSNLACARSSSFEKGRRPPRCIRSGESRPHGTNCRVPPLSLSEKARASEREREGERGRRERGKGRASRPHGIRWLVPPLSRCRQRLSYCLRLHALVVRAVSYEPVSKKCPAASLLNSEREQEKRTKKWRQRGREGRRFTSPFSPSLSLLSLSLSVSLSLGVCG
jgi:hypothetical protein